MGKTNRKSLHRIRYTSFENYYKGEWRDREMTMRAYGRDMAPKFRKQARAIWARAGRDGQKDFNERDGCPRGLYGLDRAFIRRAEKTMTKQMIHQGLNGADWDNLPLPTRRAAKAKAIKGYDYH